MIKVARKPSTDPVQEKLRQNKALWNKEVSTFINDLINFKKTMNGMPSKFHQEKSSIKEPIPADPTTIIGVLADDFQQLAQKGNSIIQEQVQYSKNRRRGKPKQMNLPFPEQPEAGKQDLSQQLNLPMTAATQNDLVKLAESLEAKYLEKEASNPLTRFFAKMLNPSFGFSEAARIRRHRMSLLDACVKTYRNLGKFQVEIVRQSKSSVDSANTKLHDAWNSWRVVYTGFSVYKQNMPAKAPDSGGEIAPPKDLLEEKEKEKVQKEKVSKLPAKEVAPEAEIAPAPQQAATQESIARAIFSDLKSIEFGKHFSPQDMTHLSTLNNVMNQFLMASKEEKEQQAALVIDTYNKVLAELSATYGPSESLAEVLSKAKNKPQTPPDQLEVTAQAFLKKWLGKTIHQLSPFDNTSSYRRCL